MYHDHGKNSSELVKIITNSIKKKGPITFYEFMKLALYHHQYGYYTAGTLPIGGKGDFVTSPHASKLFGSAICCQLYEMWCLSGRGQFDLVEIGAGSGLLMMDILDYSQRVLPEFFRSLRVTIIEPIKGLKVQQQITLNGYECSWFDDLSQITGISGCILSNELIDSFPVHLIRKTMDDFLEVYVDIGANGRFKEALGPLSSPSLGPYISQFLGHVEQGYTTEVNLDLKGWLKDISKILDRGFVFTIDYGFSSQEYFNLQRSRGTLISYRGQKVTEDILADPGAQDITHHVNFSDMVRWGKYEGIQPVGFCNQWSFFASIGIDRIMENIFPKGLSPFSPELAGIKMLLLPQGMGDTHKFLIQSKGIDMDKLALTGFKVQNKIERLL